MQTAQYRYGVFNMSTISPNMSLIIPTAGDTNGPQYAFDVNASLTLIDQHDHTPGKGSQITPAGLNINTDLSFNSHFATDVAGVEFVAQITLPSVNTIYQSGVDLYFADGVGNQIRITEAGGIAGTPGSIANLVAPASASYVALSSSFLWKSNTTIPANMDNGSVTIREVVANGNGVTLSAPTGLSANYSLTFPTALPATRNILTVDNAGALANLEVDNSTLEINANLLQVKDLGITTAKLAALAVTTAKVADGAITRPKLAALGQQSSTTCSAFSISSTTFTAVTNLSVTITTTGRPIMLRLNSDDSPNEAVLGVFTNGASGDFTTQVAYNTNGGAYSSPYSTRLIAFTSGQIQTVPSSSASWFIPVAAGTYTFTIGLKISSTAGGAAAFLNNTVLIAYEL